MKIRTKGPDGLYIDSDHGGTVRLFRAARSDQPDGRRTFEAVMSRADLVALVGEHMAAPPPAKPGTSREPLVGRRLEEQRAADAARPAQDAAAGRSRNRPTATLVTDPAELRAMGIAGLRLQARARSDSISGRSKKELRDEIEAWDASHG